MNPYKKLITPLDSKTKEEVYDETSEMIVGILVCTMATSCWTDVTSNVGRFLKLAHPCAHVYPDDGSVDLSAKKNPAYGF